jgi:predicted ATPase/DNA-binding XRE family transcriptional regulator
MFSWEGSVLETAESFGQWLRKHRRGMDLTQSELASRVGCAQVTVKKLEADQLRPSKQLAEAVIHQLGIQAGECEALVRFARGGYGPNLPSLKFPKNNLPVELTSFIGRDREIAEVKQAIHEHRLVTLTGAGGTGKTRLSLKVGAELLDLFPDGIWFIELAPLANSDLIPQTIISILNLHVDGGRTAIQVLCDYLREKKTLLILDNCEHLIETCGKQAEALLNAASGLKILATSREALGISGEVIWVVPSLSLPDTKTLLQVEELYQYEAIELFVERARLVQPHFDLTKSNASSVAQICYHLDGIPLAIELAAARIKMMTAEQINSHLDNRFQLLTGGSRTALPRHQTLRAAIDWSYDLLSESEQLLLRRLAAFSGGWSLDAAEQICADEKLDQAEILGLMGKLVDKSLITAEETKLGERYSILETVRQYARERLITSSELEWIQDQQLKFMLELAEQAEPEIRGHNQLLWLDRLDAEIDNLRVALTWSQDRDKESCLRLASALWRFWEIKEYSPEEMEWLINILDLTEASRTVVRARALARASHLIFNHGYIERTRTFADEAYTLGMQLDDKPSMARALLILGSLEIDYYGKRNGVDMLEQCLKLSREIGDHGLIASALIQFGLWTRESNLTLSISLLEQGLSEARLSGDKRLISFGLGNLADNILAQGNAEYARNLLQEALSIAQEISDQGNVISRYCSLSNTGLFLEDYAYAEEHAVMASRLARSHYNKKDLYLSLNQLSIISWACGNSSRFRKQTDEMVALARVLDNQFYIADALCVLGRAFMLDGDLLQARSTLMEVFAICVESKLVYQNHLYLQLLGELAISQNQVEIGVCLMGAQEKVLRSVFPLNNYPFMRREREGYIATARKQLSEEAFKQAWEKGYAMTLDQAVEYALKVK